MKIYTSQATQYGKSLKILNKKVTFDKGGRAEVEDDHGKAMIEYSEWFTSEKPVAKEKPTKKDTQESSILESEIELLKGKIEKAKLQDESRVKKIKSLENENQSIRGDMGKVVEERDELKKVIENKEAIFTDEKDVLEMKYSMALKEVDELKEICGQLGVEEKEYIKKRSKESLIEIIIKASK